MALKECPVCGEKYSDTYRHCPFCEEEEALQRGTRVRRSGHGKRAAGRQSQPSFLSPILVTIVLLLAALLVYLLFGDRIAERFLGGGEDTPGVEDTTKPEPSGGGEVIPQEPDIPDAGTEPDASREVDNALDYAAVEALSEGLTLSTTDFTLRTPGETHTIQVSGGSGSYTWVSQDDGIASVAQDGTVTAVSRGTVNVLVTDGVKKGTCIVRCNVTGTLPAAPATGTGSGTASGSGDTGSGTLRTGSAVVINGGNGVRVRSGPGTTYDVLATVPNGASVQIKESAGDGWYQITFSGAGGAETAGYMKGEFLKNS